MANAFDANTSNRLVDEQDAADYVGFTKRALQNWRHRGGGPQYVRVSSRAIRYRLCDLDDWATARLVSNTSQPLDVA